MARQIAEWLDYEGSIGGDEAEVNAEPTEPIEPVDLWGSFEPPTLPRGLLPERIENYALVQGEAMGVDPGGIAMAALAVCAAAIPDGIKLVMKGSSSGLKDTGGRWSDGTGWSRRGCGLGWSDCPARRSPRSSRATVRPLARLDAELLETYLSEMQPTSSSTRRSAKEAEKPVQKRLRLEDTTIEAAQEVLAGSPDGVLLVQDELSGFFGSMDKYSGHRGAAKDRGFWLQSYNGGPYALNRISRGVGIIPNLSVSLLGGIQPDVIRRLSSESYDDGFLQRMLLIVMRPARSARHVRGRTCRGITPN